MCSFCFLNGFGYPLGPVCRSKNCEDTVSGLLAAGMGPWSEKCVILEWLEPGKVSSRRDESMILMLCSTPENDFILKVVLVPPFEAFGVSYRRKQFYSIIANEEPNIHLKQARV